MRTLLIALAAVILVIFVADVLTPPNEKMFSSDELSQKSCLAQMRVLHEAVQTYNTAASEPLHDLSRASLGLLVDRGLLETSVVTCPQPARQTLPLGIEKYWQHFSPLLIEVPNQYFLETTASGTVHISCRFHGRLPAELFGSPAGVAPREDRHQPGKELQGNDEGTVAVPMPPAENR